MDHPSTTTTCPPDPQSAKSAISMTFPTPCAQPKLHNSRRRKRQGFSGYLSSESSPEFRQPAKLYTGSKLSGPSVSARGCELTRTTQIPPTPAKTESSKSGRGRDSKPKAYVLDAPPQAQMFPDNRFSDFYPWRGNHAEDTVTDAQARNGQYDKLFVGKSNNEQASAKSTLAPAFKQRTGLTTLSSLMLTIMDKRQQCSRLSTASTFKPPPRVTLPDSRREAWLRDLANPVVPLRRLSRTIPHGLKGPQLLDQCCSKAIPAARAVWFVRCVGANELRGLKRKGVGSFAVGGEGKWIREWTTHIIGFLEKTISACGTPPGDARWYDRMIYATRLVSHLYAECLLDRTVLLEWYLSFLEASSLDRLPLVYTLATVFWEDIMRLRKLARRFSDVVLAKSQQMWADGAPDIIMPLLRRLSILTSDAVLHHRMSLIRPCPRDDFEKSLIFIDSRDRRLKRCVDNVIQRQKAVEFSGLSALSATKEAPENPSLVECLDRAHVPFNTGEIYRKYAYALRQPQNIRSACEWAVTSLRAGAYRAHLVASLLRSAYVDNVNIQDPIMEFLGAFTLPRTTTSRSDVYLLISELVRGRVFSVASYMRWLIARGSLPNIGVLKVDSPCEVRLLAEIPIHSISQRLKNLRNILLFGCGYSCEEEAQKVTETKDLLLRRGVFGGPETEVESFTADELQTLNDLSRTVKSDVGLWLSGWMKEHLARGQRVGQNNWRDLSTEGLKSMNLSQLMCIRQLLETFGDMVILAEVTTVMLNSDECLVLTMVTETMSCNLSSFSVLGVVDDFIGTLTTRYKLLQLRHALTKEFLTSFHELLVASRSDPATQQELNHDLRTYDQQYPRSAIARSPISESMDDIFDEEDDNNDEINRLWDTGAEVDRPSISRLFETTVSNMESTFDDAENQNGIVSATNGLSRLRQFDPGFFDELVTGWVARVKYSSNRLALFRTFSSLVAAGCLRLGILAEASMSVQPQDFEGKSSYGGDYMFVSRCLKLIVQEDPFGTALTVKDFYVLKRKRLLFVQNYPAEFLGLYRRIIELCNTSQDEESDQNLRELMRIPEALEILREISARNLDVVKSVVVDPLLEQGGSSVIWLQIFIDNILDDYDPNDNTDLDAHVQVARLLNLVDDFSLGLCKMKLQIIFKATEKSPEYSLPDNGNSSPTISRSFVRGIASSYYDRRKICADLVSVLNKDCAGRIRADAESLLLDPRNFLQSRPLLETLELPSPNDSHDTGESLARSLLSVIEATAFSVPTTGIPALSSLLVDRLSKMLQSMTGQDYTSDRIDHTIPDLPWRSADAQSELRCWFVLFMRLIVLHRASFAAKPAMPDQVRLLFEISQLLGQEFVRAEEAHTEFVLDVASCFADGLADETRGQLRRYVRSTRRAAPPAVTPYLIGAQEAVENLKASQKGRVLDFPVKVWERLAEPTPQFGENDTCLSLRLFRTRKT